MKNLAYTLMLLAGMACSYSSSYCKAVYDSEESGRLLPNCGWQIKCDLANANWAIPEAGSVYWVYVYELRQGESLRIEGEYPCRRVKGQMQWTRFFSLQTYSVNALAASGEFPAIGAGSHIAAIVDADIIPTEGSTNPYAVGSKPDQDDQQMPSKWTIIVSADAETNTSTSAVRNVLAAYPRAYGHKPYGSRGALILRYYLPIDGYPLGEDSPSMGGVELPAITQIDSSGNESAIGNCLGLVRNFVTSRVEPRSVIIPPIGFQDQGPAFIRPLAADVSYRNSANRYLYTEAVYRADRQDRMLRIRGKMPRTPKTMPAPYDKRPDSIVMPSTAGYDMRYWSIGINKNTHPYPTVLGGGVHDAEINLDTAGYYTVIVSKPEDRPSWWSDPLDARNKALNWVNWTDSQNVGEENSIGLVMRNLLSSKDFLHSINNVPKGSSPQEARNAMGEYYPVIDWIDATKL